MIDDIHEPLAQYAAHFKDAHARHTAEFFEDLVQQSGVDEAANVQTVQELRQLEGKHNGASSTHTWWRVLRWLTVVAAVLAGLYVLSKFHWLWLVVPVVGFGAILHKLSRVIRDADATVKALEQACNDKRAEAWGQMAPLNRLYGWDIATKLVQQTVPRIVFDPYFSNGRLDELCAIFGWSGQVGDDQSIVVSHTGVLNGNPFVLARTLAHWMGSKTYHGSLQISWTEEVRGSDGKWHTETRHETLNASVEQPYPEFDNRTFFIYGNEAAPDLSFSRSPSKLSKLDDGLFDKWKKNRAIKKLEKKSQDLSDSFTVMANREFDAIFNATDRDHEVQFRLLFTPLAQQEMLNLLKDSEIGYGDDFEFIKSYMINFVQPGHMRQTDVGGEPEKFHSYDLRSARRHFNDYHNDFFRSFYFGIAPLLAIPLYQQHRPHHDIYKDVYANRSCAWEHESIANYLGERAFQHPDCVTHSILKTTAQIDADGAQTVRVSAHGYRSVERLTHVSVRGGDGKSHAVPVHWTEYIDVHHDSNMVVRETTRTADETHEAADQEKSAMRKVFEQRGVEYQRATLRRSIAAAVLP